MPNTRKKSYVRKLTHSDRCANPLNLPGHKGKNLRKIPKLIQQVFPNLPKDAKICHRCRKSCDGADDSHSASRAPLQQSDSEDNAIKMVHSRDNSLSTESVDSIVDSDVDEVTPQSKKQCTSREQELEELLTGLKEKFSSLPPHDPLRVSILTILPESWSLRKIVDEFDTSFRMAKKAKDLRKSEGVLASPYLKKGKTLLSETIETVTKFYENDQNSRIMPHKKSTVTVTTNGKREKMQKRLLLCDVKILHQQFREEFPQYPIGKTKFAELRPKWCVLAGSSGTHSVCICVIHQNFKLMLEAIDLPNLTRNLEHQLNDYTDCVSFILCSNTSPDCYLNKCNSCPRIKKLSSYFSEAFAQTNTSHVIFSAWQSTDRCTLKKECLSTDDFTDELCNRLVSFIPHHFISKIQAKYIFERKELLRNDEVLVYSDFSENYAYVAQDAAQAFHYNNAQCTVHPIVFYYKSGNELMHRTIVLLSPCTNHDVAAVYLMQQRIIPEIRTFCPQVKKIIYVTDGAKQHYKNRFQMCNLMHHLEDFGLEAEWHFHATAHGKGACDGVGAIVKREATRASLQAAACQAILNSEDLFAWAKRKFTNIKFFHYVVADHERAQRHLAKRFSNAPRIKNIQMGHAFIPISNRRLRVMRYSSATHPLSIMQY